MIEGNLVVAGASTILGSAGVALGALRIKEMREKKISGPDTYIPRIDNGEEGGVEVEIREEEKKEKVEEAEVAFEKKEAERVETSNLKKVNKKEAYVKKRSFHIGFIEKEVEADELKEKAPLLFYIREDGKIEVIKNIKPGTLNDKAEEEKILHKITSNKALEWEYKGVSMPVYLLHEKEFSCYPVETKFDSKLIYQILQSMKSNDEAYEEGLFGSLTMKKVKMWLILIGGFVGIILGGWYVGDILGIWDSMKNTILNNPEAVNATINATKNVTKTIVNM